LWAFDLTASGDELISVGEDNKLMVWDPVSHTLVRKAPVSSAPAALRRKDKRAATTSSGVR
jgi:hypothetical protein